MPNITIYLSTELYSKFMSAEADKRKAAREKAVKVIEERLEDGM